jgi:hypothetical protein
MGFVMADVRPALSTVSAEDQRLVFELLKRRLCLEVSAIAMTDLDQDIRVLTGRRFGSIKVFMGSSQKVVIGPSRCLYTPLHSNTPSGPGPWSPEQEVVMSFTHHFFSRPCRV